MEISENSAREAIASIVKRSLLRIRALASKSDLQAIGVEAYHVHNLPSLLAVFSLPALKYYWEIERVEYLSHSDPDVRRIHGADWETIDLFLKKELAGKAQVTPPAQPSAARPGERA